MLTQGSAALPARASRGHQPAGAGAPGERGQLLGAGGEESRGAAFGRAAQALRSPQLPCPAHRCRTGRDRAQEPATKRREAVASPQTHQTARAARAPLSHPPRTAPTGTRPAGPRGAAPRRYSAPDFPAAPFAGPCARKTQVTGRLQKRSNKIIPYFAEKCLRNSVRDHYCSWLSGGTPAVRKQQRHAAWRAGKRPRRNVSS